MIMQRWLHLAPRALGRWVQQLQAVLGARGRKQGATGARVGVELRAVALPRILVCIVARGRE